MKIRRFPFLLPVLLFANAMASAEPLADLKGTLARFNGNEPISGRVEFQQISQGGEDKKGKSRQSQATIAVDAGPQGLKLGWSTAQLQAARREARAKQVDKDAATPNLDALSALSARDAAKLLDYADELDEQLTNAKLLEDRAGSWQGQPARLLRLKLPAPMNGEDAKMINSFEHEFQLWLGPDGVPVGLERNLSFKASKFLISFEGGEKETLQLGRVGTRLVVLDSRKEARGAGLGFSSSSSTHTVLRLP
jgi:hypothetical protein